MPYYPPPAAGGGTAASTTEVLTGTNTTKFVTPDALAAIWEDGGSVASAATLTLGEGGSFFVTGTTDITAIAFAVPKDGRPAFLRFQGVLNLWHHATNLILPNGGTGASLMTTAAGDIALMKQEASGSMRMVGYFPANGSMPWNLVIGASGQSGFFGDLRLRDTGADHYLTLYSFENLTADRQLLIQLNDANRTLTIAASATISGTNTGDQTVPAAGAQSDQETATSTTTYVSPGRQQYHPSACKAWADINAASTTPNASYGVSSVTNGVGVTVVSFTNSFSSANYAIIASVERSNSTTTVTDAKSVVIKNATQAAGSVELQCWDATATNNVIEDPTSFYMCAFGDI